MFNESLGVIGKNDSILKHRSIWAGFSSLKVYSVSSGWKNQELDDWITEQDNSKDCFKTSTLRNQYNASNPTTVCLLNVNTLSFALFPPLQLQVWCEENECMK